MIAVMIEQLLRDRPGMTARIQSGGRGVIPVMLAVIAVSMIVVGAALGSYRGGVQIAYAAIKLPMVLIGTALLSAPALTAIGTALGRPSKLRTDFALVIAALAFGALLLVSCTPLILVGRALEVPYHRFILAVVAMFAIAGLASLRMIVRGSGQSWSGADSRPAGSTAAVGGLCVVFALVCGQLAWALRPYLVRPRAEVEFLRPVEGSLVDSIAQALDSARGIYRRERAPLPAEE